MGTQALLLVSVVLVALVARRRAASLGGPTGSVPSQTTAALLTLRRLVGRVQLALLGAYRAASQPQAGVARSLSSSRLRASGDQKRRSSEFSFDDLEAGDATLAGSSSIVITQTQAAPVLAYPSAGPAAAAAAAARRSLEQFEEEDKPSGSPSFSRRSEANALEHHSWEEEGRRRLQQQAASPRPSQALSPHTHALLFPGERFARPQPLLRDSADVAFVLSCVPPLLRAQQWRLLYATQRDGVSLHTLLRASQGTRGPALLLVRDSQGFAFGSYTSDSWCIHAQGHRSFGTGECFVFALRPGAQRAYRWAGADGAAAAAARVFQVASSDALSLGGAPHFAIWLDADLRYGSSGACSTFDSPCLAGCPEFEVAQLELWHFGADGAAVAMQRDEAAARGEARRSMERNAAAAGP